MVTASCNELQVAVGGLVFEMTARPLSCELYVPDSSDCAAYFVVYERVDMQ